MNHNKYSIVLVEDDELLLENYTEILSDVGYRVRGFDNRHQAIENIRQHTPDMVILDIGLDLERDGGIKLCKQLRLEYTTLPIIFLTSHSADSDRITGLQCEVDDYLTKDISIDYLLVRVETLFKRIYQLKTGQSQVESNILLRGELRLDMDSQQAYWKDEKVNISLRQYQMLQELALYPGHPKTPSKLMSVANIVVEPNTIAANIKSIRKEFKKIDPEFSMIKAEYGTGYRWLKSSGKLGI